MSESQPLPAALVNYLVQLEGRIAPERQAAIMGFVSGLNVDLDKLNVTVDMASRTYTVTEKD